LQLNEADDFFRHDELLVGANARVFRPQAPQINDSFFFAIDGHRVG